MVTNGEMRKEKKKKFNHLKRFSSGTSGKEPACLCRRQKRDTGSIPGSGRSPRGGPGNHTSILTWRITMDRGAWQATVHRFTESNMTEAT